MKKLALTALMLFFSNHVQAADLKLLFPVSCEHGTTCWIQSYMDTDRVSGQAQDFMCGARARDGYAGTDIAVRDIQTAAAGVRVVAAAAGTVGYMVRDLPDGAGNAGRFPCGNALVIEHESGWQTRYCHLKQGSIPVMPGQKVEAGQPVGEIGLSGATDWPRLSFFLTRNGMAHDPFTGRTDLEGCGLPGDTLWADPASLPYQPFAVINLGFGIVAPDAAALGRGVDKIVALSSDAPRLTFWAYLIGTQAGDRIELSVEDPDGDEFLRLEGDAGEFMERRLASASRERVREVWEPGLYTGTIRLVRNVGAERKTTVWKSAVRLY